jgi:ribosomal protein L5
LKIKKGNPVGCKVILKKHTMYFFYFKLITSIFLKIKRPQYRGHLI